MKQFIYIVTDSNRKNLHVGLTEDLAYTMKYYKEKHSLFFDSHKRASRLVYFEEVVTPNQVMDRFKEISNFTRIQKEKIIRVANTNWNDLSLKPGFEIDLLGNNLNYKSQMYAS